MTTYPKAPGFKDHDSETGRESAQAVAGKAKELRDKIAEAYKGAAMTPDECADLLRPADMTDIAFETFRRSVRSRVSELKAEGILDKTSQRRENTSGHKAVVYCRAAATAQLGLNLE